MDNISEVTNFPYGISSFGIPQIGSGRIPVTNGNYYFVDGTNGNDGSDGASMLTALKTIGTAVNRAVAGDVILVLPGTYTETITADVSDLSIIGLGTTTKSVILTSATDTNTLTIAAGNISVSGFYFRVPTRTSTTSSAIKLSGANYAHISGNRFQGQTGSYYAIYSPTCDSDNVIIEGNDFEYMNTATNGSGIYCVEAGGLSYSDWQIKNNKFSSCVRAVYLNGRVCLVQGNHFAQEGITAAGALGSVTTTKLTLAGATGTNSGGNLVHGNYFGGTYSNAGGYIQGTTVDDWGGNYNIAGVTAALPA